MRATILASTILVPLSLVPQVHAGTLDPPGPPAPTMKTIEQAEPRTPISSLPFTINAAGSYYLTKNLTATSAVNGITVNAVSPVTIDLNGFTLDGAGFFVDGIAIVVPAPAKGRVTIKHGVVSGWVNGIYQDLSGPDLVLEDVRVHDCFNSGVYVHDVFVFRSSITGNAGMGMVSQGVAVVRDSRFGKNELGLYALGARSLVEDSVFDDNRNLGLYVGEASIVRHCVVANNQNHGIIIGPRVLVLENNVYGNLASGIYTESAGEGRIEGNNITSNANFGIHSWVGGMVIVKNTARGNQVANYSISGPSNVAPVDFTGTSTNPWANFSF